MTWRLFAILALMIAISGDASAQFSRTPAGENIDVKVLARTPDSLKGKPIVDSSGTLLGVLDGVVVSGPATLAVVTLSTPPHADRRIVARLADFKIDRQDRITTSKSAAELAENEEYNGHIPYQELTGDSPTIGDALSSYD